MIITKHSQRGTTLIGMLFFIVGTVISYFIFQSDWGVFAKGLAFFFVALPFLAQPFRY